MRIERVRIADIIPYENNPRVNDGAVEAVAESIRQCGYRAKIIVDENMVVLAGHTRLKALKRLDVEECEVQVETDLTEEQKRKYRLLDNKTNEFATWDFNVLDSELPDIDFEGFNFGFDTVDNVSDEFGDTFTLPDGDKNEICQMTFTIHKRQKELIEYAMSLCENDIKETYGNTNKKGNQLYEVVRQWAEQKKLN